MRFNYKRILIGVLIASVASRAYDSFNKRLEHKDRNLHEGLVLISVFLILWRLPGN
jgi:hypothetical protein